MLDDPRIKRVLKRYLKADKISESEIDVSALGDAELLQACRLTDETALVKPVALDESALAYLAQRMGITFDAMEFDYFLHSYTKPGFASDPTLTSKPAPEDGPHPKIPIKKGMRWRSVRPDDEGLETWEAWEFREDPAED
jgi:hypothetical protein